MAFILEFKVTTSTVQEMARGKGVFLNLDVLFCLLLRGLLARCDIWMCQTHVQEQLFLGFPPCMSQAQWKN